MKKSIFMVSLGLLLVLVTACGNNPKLKNGEEVVVKIDGLKVSADKLYNTLKAKYGYTEAINMIDEYIANKEIKDSDEINDYVKEVVDYYTSYAENSGMDLESFLEYNGVESQEEFEKTIKNQRKLELAIKKQVGADFTDEEVENYYNNKYSEKLTVKHILINFDEDGDEEDSALSTANMLIDKLKETSKDNLTKTFDDLAYEYSADSSASNGGLIENFMASEVVKEFWDASKKLKANEFTTEPVKSQYGYHIILKVSETEKEKLEDVKDEIRNKLADEKLQSDSLLQSTTLIALRKKYNFKIYDTDIEKGYNDFKKSVEK